MLRRSICRYTFANLPKHLPEVVVLLALSPLLGNRNALVTNLIGFLERSISALFRVVWASHEPVTLRFSSCQAVTMRSIASLCSCKGSIPWESKDATPSH